jgi:hypothetical protein
LSKHTLQTISKKNNIDLILFLEKNYLMVGIICATHIGKKEFLNMSIDDKLLNISNGSVSLVDAYVFLIEIGDINAFKAIYNKFKFPDFPNTIHDMDRILDQMMMHYNVQILEFVHNLGYTLKFQNGITWLSEYSYKIKYDIFYTKPDECSLDKKYQDWVYLHENNIISWSQSEINLLLYVDDYRFIKYGLTYCDIKPSVTRVML